MALHSMGFEMPTSPENTGSEPEEVIATMATQESSKGEEIAHSHSSSVMPTEKLTDTPRRRRSRRRERRRRVCQGPYQHGNRLHVYNILSKHATNGVTNKNAADTLGDMAFIFGSSGVPTPRGVEEYYDDGIISMNHLSISSWGDYLQCNHPDGSTTYSCKCPKDNRWPCDMERAGKEQGSHTNGHIWYSFPHAGQHTYWDYEHGSGCESIQVRASCVIDALASKAGCPGKCSSNNAKECVNCVNKLPDKDKEHVWDWAVLQKHCPDSRRRRRAMGNASAVMQGEQASTAVIV